MASSGSDSDATAAGASAGATGNSAADVRPAGTGTRPGEPTGIAGHAAAPSGSTALPPYPSRRRAWYVVSVLLLIYMVGFIDRQVLNLLVRPIKRDFVLTDFQMSLLQGLAFMASYVAMSPLFGRWADTGNRRNILMGAALAWSGFTILCGFARHYVMLFAARLGVGGAEAALIPASWSIIADNFPPKDMARAFSLFLMGPYIGGGLALVFGGALIKAMGGIDGPPIMGLAPWQMTFVAIGVPGVLLALLLLTISEPQRRSITAGAKATPVPMAEVTHALWESRRFYINFYLGMSCMIISLYAFPAWMPAMLTRKFGGDEGAVGLQYGMIVLVAGCLGVFAGPFIGRWLERRGYEDGLLRVPVFAAIALILCCIALSQARDYTSAITIAAVAGFVYAIPQAMTATALQVFTPNRMRGLISAIYVFIVSVIGLGLAPTAVALVNKTVFADEREIGTSLAIVCGLAALAAVFLLAATWKPYRAALAAARANDDQPHG